MWADISRTCSEHDKLSVLGAFLTLALYSRMQDAKSLSAYNTVRRRIHVCESRTFIDRTIRIKY